MARRRDEEGGPGDVLPRELLGPGARNARRAWFHAHQLYDFGDQWEAMQAARREHAIPNAPDPRLLLVDPDNFTPDQEEID